MDVEWLVYAIESACLVLYMEGEGEAGMTAFMEDRADARPDAFPLSNGQVHEFPWSWTVPLNVALEVPHQFCLTAEPRGAVS